MKPVSELGKKELRAYISHRQNAKLLCGYPLQKEDALRRKRGDYRISVTELVLNGGSSWKK